MIRYIKIVLLLVCCVLPFMLGAQSPVWIYPEHRELSFPPETYFSEFTQGNLRNNEDVSTLLERLKTDAKRGLASNIRTHITSRIEKEERQIANNQDYRFYSVYQDYTLQMVEADVVGVKVESHYNASKKWGYAFAYVKKNDLVVYYPAQIERLLKQVENALHAADIAIQAKNKAQARMACENALQPLAQVESAQGLLTAIDPGNTDGLQFERLAILKNELFQQLMDLEQSTYVYIQCSETNFGKPVRILEPELKRLLSNSQCSFTDDPAEADFKITVTATTRQHDGSAVFGDGTLKFSLADVEVEVYNNRKKKVVYSEGLSQKNNRDGATYESAGRNALKLAASKVWEGMRPFVVGEAQ
ncbi:MAG: hypothetical protein J5792_06780 [Bacteroidales bacterium]|nr:hypothetical protein [Bacteroidales bacterium]